MLPRRASRSGPAATVTVAAAILMFQCTSAFAISSSTLRILSGQFLGDQFGKSVASAGDFNHDGFPDVIVGSPLNDAGGASAGRAYIYFGGPGSDSTADVILTGTTGENFGASVAAAGDVNGDGTDDVIVGAPFGGGTGRAYVFYGGMVPNNVADLMLVGAASQDQFGARVASAGDFNGDGFADIVVGAPLSDSGGVSTDNRGRAYIYFGGSSPNAVADVVLTGQAAGDNFGFVQSAGDFDGDGFGDVIVGAPNNDAGGASSDNRGRAYVFRGGSAPDAVADMTLTGAAPGDNFGSAVAPAGDVNGDGYGDVIVGAPNNDAGGVGTDNRGRAYVFYGGPMADATPDLTLTGTVAGETLGASVAGAGDINQDGFSDLAVGAPLSNAEAGRVYVFFGAAVPNAVPAVVFNGANALDGLGWSVAAAGDVDEDGFPELIAGAPITFEGGPPGAAHIFSIYPYRALAPRGGDTWAAGSRVDVRWRGHDLADLELSTDGGLSFSVKYRGLGGQDVNSFSLVCPDVSAGSAMVRMTMTGQTATRSNSALSRPFRIVRYGPSAPIAVKLGAKTFGTSNADSVGASLLAGDFTGDGTAEIMIGDPHIYPGGAYGGSVAGFIDPDGNSPCLGPNPPWWCIFALHGRDPGDAFGFSLASIGDFNGDGYDDWIVGAPRAHVGPNADVGKAYVYFGGATLDTVPDLILSGSSAGEQFGFAVAGAGDFNRDGFDDIAVSAPFNAVLGPNSGRVYVFYGGSSPNNVADLQLNARAPGESFGRSLAGRINLGDILCPPSICDPPPPFLLIGAPFNDAAGLDAGAAYGYLGGAGLDTIPDMALFGNQAGANFGMAVAGIGDVNGDRIDDIAIGAPNDDTNGAAAGQVRVVLLGNPAGMPAPDQPCIGFPGPCCPFCGFDWRLWGENPGDRFGTSLGSMDFNLDGLSDILVGGPGCDFGGVDAGRVYGFAGAVTAGLTQFNEPTPQPGFVLDGPASGKALGGVIGVVAPESFSGVAARAAMARGKRLAVAGMMTEPVPIPWGPVLMPRRAILATLRDSLVHEYDINRFHLLDNMAGVQWQVGSLQRISWFGNAGAQIDLSTDGGQSWSPLAQVAAKAGFDGSGPTGTRRSIGIRVPHVPTRFARVRIWPWPWPPCLTCPPFVGYDQTDTIFTIRTSITLLSFAVQMGSEGASLAWATDVEVSPEGIAGYRLYRMTPGASGGGERIGPELITETHFTDPDAVPGAAYRLVGVNGLAEELELGKVALEQAIRGLRLSPSPVSARGSVSIAFAAPQAAPGISATDLDVSVFDVSGRRVADLAHGYAKPEAGVVRLTWNLAGRGGKVGPGVYFVKAIAPSAGLRIERKVVVLP